MANIRIENLELTSAEMASINGGNLCLDVYNGIKKQSADALRTVHSACKVVGASVVDAFTSESEEFAPPSAPGDAGAPGGESRGGGGAPSCRYLGVWRVPYNLM